MGVVISKPAINLREKLTELKAQQGYEERQFHFDNLVTNGTFDTDTSGWTSGNSAALSVVSTQLRISNSAASNGFAVQSISTEQGKTYLISATVTAGSNNGRLGAGTAQGTPFNIATSSFGTGLQTLTFTAQGATTYIGLQTEGASIGNTTDFDNVSVYTSDGTGVAFPMPKGWKPLHVYEDGVLQREGSAEDYEVTFDGFNYYVKPTVANPGARNTVIGVRA